MRHVRAEVGDVVTCGFGPTPSGTVEHLRVEDVPSLPQTPSGVAMLATRPCAATFDAAAGAPAWGRHARVGSAGVLPRLELPSAGRSAGNPSLADVPVAGGRGHHRHGAQAVRFPDGTPRAWSRRPPACPTASPWICTLSPAGRGRHLRQSRAAAIGHDRVCFHDPWPRRTGDGSIGPGQRFGLVADDLGAEARARLAAVRPGPAFRGHGGSDAAARDLSAKQDAPTSDACREVDAR
jgi:hypothetical protein